MAALLKTDCKQLCRSRFCCGRPSKHASWGAPHSLCSNFRWTHTCLSSDFSLFTETFSCVGSLHLFFSSSSSSFFFFFLQSTYEEELNCVGLEHISGHSVEWLPSTYSLPFHSPSSGSWQPLGLHIIWIISLYFYAADVSPCQQASWQSKMENPPLLKCCTWVPPSSLSVALPTQTFVIPWDTVPCPILIVGKHILINACVCTEVCRSDTQEHKDSDLLYFCGWLDD